jgi:hypothetical protein
MAPLCASADQIKELMEGREIGLDRWKDVDVFMRQGRSPTSPRHRGALGGGLERRAVIFFARICVLRYFCRFAQRTFTSCHCSIYVLNCAVDVIPGRFRIEADFRCRKGEWQR